jgi:dihydrofolate reductase
VPVRTLTYFVAVSVDGFIASPTDTFEAFPPQGDHIDWILREWTDTVPGAALDALGLSADGSRVDTAVMGWGTLAAGFPFGVVDPYPHLRSYVVTHHPDRELPGEPGANLTLTDEDPVALVRRLKAQDGSGIWLCGGGALAASVVDEIDTMVLKVNPILLGDGKRLFAQHAYAVRGLELTASRPFGSGVVVNTYARRR